MYFTLQLTITSSPRLAITASPEHAAGHQALLAVHAFVVTEVHLSVACCLIPETACGRSRIRHPVHPSEVHLLSV
jgi:hypothetical protein